MTNSITNQLTLTTFDFNSLTPQQIEGLFTNFISAKLVLTDCDGKEVSLSVMEVLERETEFCDEDGFTIASDELVY